MNYTEQTYIKILSKINSVNWNSTKVQIITAICYCLLSYPLNYLCIKYLAIEPEVYSDRDNFAYIAAFIFLISPASLPILLVLTVLTLGLSIFMGILSPLSRLFI